MQPGGRLRGLVRNKQLPKHSQLITKVCESQSSKTYKRRRSTDGCKTAAGLQRPSDQASQCKRPPPNPLRCAEVFANLGCKAIIEIKRRIFAAEEEQLFAKRRALGKMMLAHVQFSRSHILTRDATKLLSIKNVMGMHLGKCQLPQTPFACGTWRLPHRRRCLPVRVSMVMDPSEGLWLWGEICQG